MFWFFFRWKISVIRQKTYYYCIAYAYTFNFFLFNKQNCVRVIRKTFSSCEFRLERQSDKKYNFLYIQLINLSLSPQLSFAFEAEVHMYTGFVWPQLINKFSQGCALMTTQIHRLHGQKTVFILQVCGFVRNIRPLWRRKLAFLRLAS